MKVNVRFVDPCTQPLGGSFEPAPLGSHTQVIFLDIDDDSDMLPEQMDHFVHTDGFEGFSFKNFTRLCEILDTEAYGINHPRDNHGKDSVTIH